MHIPKFKYRLILLFIFFLTNANAQFLTYKTLSSEDGLLSTDMHSAIQDSKGYIWIGTKNGLCRWDSKNFEYFTVDNGLPNNEVFFLCEDAIGRIWISTFSQELCYLFNDRIYNRKNTAFLNKINNYLGIKVAVFNNELYYSSSDAKLKKFNLLTEEETILNKRKGIPQFTFTKHKEKVWAMQDNRDRKLFTYASFKNIVIGEDTSYYTPYCFYPNFPNGDIVTRIDFRNKLYYFQFGLDSPFYKAYYKDKDLRLAVYNKGRVLEVYKNYIMQTTNHYVMKVKYSESDHPEIFVIKDNILMRITDGLLFCRQTPLLEYDQNIQINNHSNHLFKYDNILFFINSEYQIINAKTQQCVNRFKNNAINIYNLLKVQNTFYLSTSFDIYYFTDPRGKINFQSPRRYSYDYNFGNFKYISPSKKVNYFFTANGVRNGIFLANFKTNDFKNILNGLSKVVYSVYEDSKSRLWYSTTNKVYYTSEYYNGVKNSKEFILDAASPLFCKSIQEDNKGNLFFTTNGGVFLYDGRKKYRIGQNNLLSDNECNKIVIDTVRNSFWVATKNGLNHIGYSKEKGSLKFKVLNKFFATDGLRSDNINDILLDSNRLYIATDKGVNILDDVNYRPDTTHIPIYFKLNAVNAVTSKTYDTLKTIELQHDQNNLTIGFSALYFLRRDRLKIQAFLYRNGSLVSKNEITGDKIDYYSLNDGDYKLVLSAYDQDYRYNNGRSLPFIFTINPPYYKTWWFIIGTSLLIIVISTGLLLWNLNRRKKRAIQQAELQAKLNESTLKSLQSQMNPHFVFNSLNTIQSFITEKNEEGAIDYLSDFSGLMREILEQSVHTFISLENEIQFLQHYVQLEMTRFKDSFDAVWNIDLEEDDLTDIYIPTMLIQPILENAVKHGVSNLDGIKGHLEITFSLVNENLLRVVVKDNGKAAAPNKKFKGNSIAVQTIKDRLNIYTKNKVKGEYHLAVSETGATATITIPI